MRTNHKKSNALLKRASTNVVNIRDEPKHTSHQAKPSQKLSNKPFCYYNRKVNTESDEVRLSHNNSKAVNRKLYLLNRGHGEKLQRPLRKSYSRQFQESKILDGKSMDYANRFTLTDCNFNDGRNQIGYNNLSQAKKHLKKTNSKPSNAAYNGRTEMGHASKKYRSPYEREKKGLENNFMKPMDIKSITKPRMQRRVVTEVNENLDHPFPSHQKHAHSKQNVVFPTRNSQSETKFEKSGKDLEIIEQIGQGTFGKVFKAIYIPTGQVVAVKKVLQDRKYKSRELEIIKMLDSEFTMRTLDSYITVQHNEGEREEYLNIIMDHYDCNLYEYLGRHRNISSSLQMKTILYQMFRGLLYIHSLGICHRDIKPHNMLVKNGKVCLCDFGSAKILKPEEANLSYICSRCYRAPELIFGSVNYTTQIDIWSAGCIILEILNKVPLFIGENSLDHLVEVIKVMGTPSKSEVIAMNSNYDLRQYDFPQIPKKQWSKLFPNTDPKLIDLINKIMRYSPQLRLTAAEAIAHQYFDDIRSQSMQKQIRLLSRNTEFFNFSKEQLKMIGNSSKLIPKWYQSESRGKSANCMR